MSLDEGRLKDGLKFIVGTWQVDFIVNFFSNDLAHIPATEFKSDDGRDFSSITFTFFEDHSLKMKDSGSGKEEEGTWEQTDNYEYHYTLNGFMDVPEGDFKNAVEKLSVQDGFLTFTLGFLVIAMKKIEEGHITKEPDIGDIVPTAEEEAHKDIVGVYEIAKVTAYIDDKFELFSKEEIAAAIEKSKAKGEEDDMLSDFLKMTDGFVEFKDDHNIYSWSKLPEGVSEKDIKEAIKSGEILDAKDGYFCRGTQEWKFVKGDYYYNTGAQRSMFDEELSPWDKLVFDENGLLPFGEGSMLLRKKNN